MVAPLAIATGVSKVSTTRRHSVNGVKPRLRHTASYLLFYLLFYLCLYLLNLLLGLNTCPSLGKMEGLQCAWWAIWDKLELKEDLTSFLQGKNTLQLCMPVQRTQYKNNSMSKTGKRHKSLYSISEAQDAKRPCSHIFKASEIDQSSERSSFTDKDIPTD